MGGDRTLPAQQPPRLQCGKYAVETLGNAEKRPGRLNGGDGNELRRARAVPVLWLAFPLQQLERCRYPPVVGGGDRVIGSQSLRHQSQCNLVLSRHLGFTQR